jgi:hypothetical protein
MRTVQRKTLIVMHGSDFKSDEQKFYRIRNYYSKPDEQMFYRIIAAYAKSKDCIKPQNNSKRTNDIEERKFLMES